MRTDIIQIAGHLLSTNRKKNPRIFHCCMSNPATTDIDFPKAYHCTGRLWHWPHLNTRKVSQETKDLSRSRTWAARVTVAGQHAFRARDSLISYKIHSWSVESISCCHHDPVFPIIIIMIIITPWRVSVLQRLHMIHLMRPKNPCVNRFMLWQIKQIDQCDYFQ